jgi:hypothetical protein
MFRIWLQIRADIWLSHVIPWCDPWQVIRSCIQCSPPPPSCILLNMPISKSACIHVSSHAVKNVLWMWRTWKRTSIYMHNGRLLSVDEAPVSSRRIDGHNLAGSIHFFLWQHAAFFKGTIRSITIYWGTLCNLGEMIIHASDLLQLKGKKSSLITRRESDRN